MLVLNYKTSGTPNFYWAFNILKKKK
jgi:hypothetical protein